MKHYDLADLSDPATYAADPALATLARRVAQATWQPGTIAFGDYKRAMLAGQHPELVAAAVQQAVNSEVAKQQSLAEGRAAVAALTPPPGLYPGSRRRRLGAGRPL